MGQVSKPEEALQDILKIAMNSVLLPEHESIEASSLMQSSVGR